MTVKKMHARSTWVAVSYIFFEKGACNNIPWISSLKYKGAIQYIPNIAPKKTRLYPLFLSYRPRLVEGLGVLKTKMMESYESLGKHLTELKLDHRDGKLPSDRLNELLGKITYCIAVFFYKT